MKKIVCEICGSNDLVKKDGMFECQSCGTKYSAEEAKKLMIEGVVDVSGSTVKIDDSNKIDSLLKNAKNLYRDNKFDEAYSLFGEVLNIDTENYIAIGYRGLCNAWKSTVNNLFIEDAMKGFLKSLNLAKVSLKVNSEYADFSIEIANEMFKISKALLNLFIDFMNMSCENSSARLKDLTSSLHRAGIYADVDYLKKQADQVVAKNQKDINLGTIGIQIILVTLNIVATNFLNENDIDIYTMKQYKILEESFDNCTYIAKNWINDNSREAFSQVNATYKRIKEIIQKKKDEYWKNHKEEKEKIESEILDNKKKIEEKNELILKLEEKRNNIKEKIDSPVPSEKEFKEISIKKENLQKEKSSLNLLKIKEKRALQEQINSLDEPIKKINEKIKMEKEELRKQYQPDIDEIDIQIAKIKQEIEKFKNKILENEQKLDNV